jgi:hypothetical protein
MNMNGSTLSGGIKMVAAEVRYLRIWVSGKTSRSMAYCQTPSGRSID